MTPRDLAEVFLRKAQQDLDAARDLASNPQIADEIIGFLSQQCVEKSLKSVLENAAVHFAKTHDLDVLRNHLVDAALDPPEWLGEALILNPFAATLRYTELEPLVPVDRPAVLALAQRACDWASEALAQTG